MLRCGRRTGPTDMALAPGTWRSVHDETMASPVVHERAVAATFHRIPPCGTQGNVYGLHVAPAASIEVAP